MSFEPDERGLPQNLDAERSVLGAVLLDPKVLAAVVPILTTDDFFPDTHRRIYGAMLEMRDRPAEIDLLTLGEQLSSNGGGVEKAGGKAYLSSLLDAVPDVTNVEHYARIVKEKSIARRLASVGQQLVRAALSQEEGAGESARRTIEGILREARAGGPRPIPATWVRPGEGLAASPLPKARFLTGLPALDRVSRRGGLPTGAAVVMQGEPDSGKTGLALQVLIEIAMKHEVVAIGFTPDQGREATEVRIGALLGLDAQKLEERDAGEMERLRQACADRRIWLPDPSDEPTTVSGVIAIAETIQPDLPHVYVFDSLQECRAHEEADDLDERHRVIANVRAIQKATSGPVPSLVLACSQVNTASFAARKVKDRSRPIAAGAESGKIGFFSSLVIHLEGDPRKAPDFGKASVVKSKLGGEKPTFGLRLDPSTTRLQEIDAAVVEEEETRQAKLELEQNLGKLAGRIIALLTKHGPLNKAAIYERVGGKAERVVQALDGLEVQGLAAWDPGPRRSKVWRLK